MPAAEAQTRRSRSSTTETLGHFRICGTCYGLYEAGRPDGLNQSCHCGPREEERWPGFDFNERACLCACCGTDVLRSGSRWSAYFCRECQLLAMGVSLWERRLVFPIGRHSMMHTFVPDAPAPSLATHDRCGSDEVQKVHGAITAISRGSDGLRQWSAIVVRSHLQRLGLPGGTLLLEYLDAIAKDRTGGTRWAAFAELCEFFRAPAGGTVN